MRVGVRNISLFLIINLKYQLLNNILLIKKNTIAFIHSKKNYKIFAGRMVLNGKTTY